MSNTRVNVSNTGLSDASEAVPVKNPDVQDEEGITPTIGSDPLVGNMITVAIDDTYLSCCRSVSALNGATAVDIELFVQLRDGSQEIIALPGGRRDDIDLNGGDVIDVLGKNVGMKIQRIGARGYAVGGPPTWEIGIRARKGV